MVTDKIAFFSGISFVNLRNTDRGWISDLNVEWVLGDWFALMRDLDSIGTNHFWLVFYTIESVFHSGNLAAYYVSTRPFEIT
jgi:hypothetical protein